MRAEGELSKTKKKAGVTNGGQDLGSRKGRQSTDRQSHGAQLNCFRPLHVVAAIASAEKPEGPAIGKLLLDNAAVMHSRDPFTPPREVVVAFAGALNNPRGGMR